MCIHTHTHTQIRPNLKWDKGEAVKWLLGALGWMDAEDVIPFYLGDDTTDEDAFHALSVDVGRGVGILVSDTPSTRATEASFSLRDCSEVKAFLNQLCAGAPTILAVPTAGTHTFSVADDGGGAGASGGGAL